MNSKRILLLVIASLALSPIARANVDVPLRNWTVPPYRVSDASGGMTTMVDVSPGIGFVAVTPCRIVDTRGGGVFTGAYGLPALVGNAAARPFDLNSAPHCTGIPAGADAYSLNFTLIAAAGAFQNAFLTAWPTGGGQPVVSTLNFNGGQLVANAAIVPAGTNGSINVFVNAPGNLLIDINGYFTDEYNPGVSFEASSSSIAPAILGENTSTVADAVAIRGVVTSTTPGASAAAVRGINNGTGGAGIGVWGSQNGGGFGVYGTSPTGYGVYGLSTSGFGVVAGTGGTTANSAVWARNTSTGDDTSGVYGSATAPSSRTYGVFGETDSFPPGFEPEFTSICAAGVYGRAGSDSIRCRTARLHGPFGVIGTSSQTGVFGLGGYSGVYGCTSDANGVEKHCGVLGLGPSGVHSFSDVTAGGTKFFVEPHPRDPGKQIKYVALEGNEVGTYFRGRAKFQRGLAMIQVPEDFRMVSEPEGLSIQVTPIGEIATFAVVRIDLNEVVVKGSRDVEFFYTVNGIRHNYSGFQPIEANVFFVPKGPDDPMREWPETHRRMLTENGTLRKDGTVNPETARRLGWDEDWEKRARPAPQPTE